MQIILENAGKRFNRDWIFRSLSYTFSQNNAYAIIGNNGSGKSTLLQSIAGAIDLNQGSCSWQNTPSSEKLPKEIIYKQLSVVAPYLELIEEMTARELLLFHEAFKPYQPGLSIQSILELVQLSEFGDKQIRFFSSGMKQRIKLAQAIFVDLPVLFLDEPCTNLDKVGYELYHRLVKEYCHEKLIIVSSNDTNEYSYCQHIIDIRDYKV